MSGAHSDKPLRVHWRPRDRQIMQRRDGVRVRVTACRRYTLASVPHTRDTDKVTCEKCRARIPVTEAVQ